MNIPNDDLLAAFAVFQASNKTDIVPSHDSIVHVLVFPKGRPSKCKLVELDQVLLFKLELVRFEEYGAAVHKGPIPLTHGPGTGLWREDTVIVAPHPELRLEELVKLALLHFLLYGRLT